MPNTTDKKTWNVAVLYIDWRADRHDESHSIEFERPTADNPSPKYPVEVGGELSKSRLSMSSSWGNLFAAVKVKAFDEYSLTIQYGEHEYVVYPDQLAVHLDEGGMDYTTFWLKIGVKYAEPGKATQKPLCITHDWQFLNRFLTKERVTRLTADDVALLRQQVMSMRCTGWGDGSTAWCLQTSRCARQKNCFVTFVKPCQKRRLPTR